MKTLTAEVVDKMFEIAGYPFRFTDVSRQGADILLSCTMTPEQKRRWFEWGKAYLRRRRDPAPEHRMQVVDMCWGLRVEQAPQPAPMQIKK
jgi:hypothetical protein